MFCDGYKAKTAAEKRQHVEANNFCFNCLGKHKLSECTSQKTCSSCRARHHTMLHDTFKVSEVATSLHFAQRSKEAIVLLATARVCVTDQDGVVHTARALLDQGSDSSMITSSLARRLRLVRQAASIRIIGVGGKPSGRVNSRVKFQILPEGRGPPITVTAMVFPQITTVSGGCKGDQRAWTHLRGLKLADPDFKEPDPLDILLGADVYAEILQPGLRKEAPHEPIAQRTSLGWVLSGSAGTTGETMQRNALSYYCQTDEDLSSLVSKFWQQKELPVSGSPLTPEDQECENFYNETHARTAEGRCVVWLPVVAPLPDLSSTRFSAQQVLLSGMEKRLDRDHRLHQLYEDFMQQYEALGHMGPVSQSEPTEERVSYLPHHGVMRESSTSTKLRVVFNGSTTTASGDSLNRRLLVGPNLLPPLCDVLLRWRRHRYVMATDVEKMYRQILVHPDDRDLQRIIWRYNRQADFQEYRLNTVTYGLSCALFLAMRTLQQLASDEEQRYPIGASVIRSDVYMDDVLTGAATLDEAQELQRQLTGLCTAGGFPLRKWSANESSILAEVPIEHQMQREPRAW
ncbi:uncharacterized protein LOC115241711 [Formica exsecta]|uniref:uncharacterized protein LOC115241711 n=1 Tax=Formica exsecta TaxID=72781 RepID=UPI0011439FB7|nr:uncharacterized protein LOC115241711 [Formica exsecta]